MMLYFLFALMTAAAIFAVLWPLGRGARERRTGGDVAVYRDQLDEIARDRASGLIGKAEAEAARVEVSRRLIAAADATETPDAQPAAATFRRRATAVAILVALPAIGLALYLTLGSPDVPGQPIASRVVPLQNRSLETLVAQVEAHLEKNPEDGRGWEVIAPVYVRLGRIEDAVKARRNALRINGTDERRRADLEADLGETLIAAANGVVTQEAKAAFERAAAQNPRQPKARFFLGVAAHQDGDAAKALTIWRELAHDTGTDSPWGIMARQGIASVEGAAAPSPGPSAEDAAAAEQMEPQDRAAMIRGMVERLAERLQRDGSDVEGWLRLVRAYTVLGDRDRAISAVADARRALGHDADKLRRIDALAKELRLES